MFAFPAVKYHCHLAYTKLVNNLSSSFSVHLWFDGPFPGEPGLGSSLQFSFSICSGREPSRDKWCRTSACWISFPSPSQWCQSTEGYSCCVPLNWWLLDHKMVITSSRVHDLRMKRTFTLDIHLDDHELLPSLITSGELELREPNSSSLLVIKSSRSQWNAVSPLVNWWSRVHEFSGTQHQSTDSIQRKSSIASSCLKQLAEIC